MRLVIFLCSDSNTDLNIDKEIEIIFELAQDLLQYEDILTACSDLCGELDW